VSGSPEELLRSALEKIVFFECRVASLESELEGARAVVARAREEAGAARRRETELERNLAQLRGEHASAAAQCAELAERVRLLEAERERFLSGMVEQARVSGAPADEEDDAGSAHDLAGFIAELRAEIEQLQSWKRAAQAAGVSVEGEAPVAPPPAPRAASVAAPVPALAERFEAAGRFGVSREQARALPSFSTRSERALYEASLDDLAASDPATRRRAADGLRALGSKGAAPLVAAALGREADAEVKAALLGALGALGEPGAAELALRELADARPAVRAAALEAASALARETVAPRLAAALGDGSALVRRRAVVLLGFTPGAPAEDALTSALGDRDAGVARAAAVALAGRPSARAQGALARALDHREPAVRRAAARAVGRWSGEVVDVAAAEPERRRAARRIAEKLLAVDGATLRSAVTHVPAAPLDSAPPALRSGRTGVSAPAAGTYRLPVTASVAPRSGVGLPVTASVAPRSGVGLPVTASVAPRSGAESSRAATRSATVTVAPPDPALAEGAVAEVRAALRGCTVDDLAAALSRDRATVEASLRALVAQGRLVARGPRFFMS
jgi:hypothetical protein